MTTKVTDDEGRSKVVVSRVKKTTVTSSFESITRMATTVAMKRASSRRLRQQTLHDGLSTILNHSSTDTDPWNLSEPSSPLSPVDPLVTIIYVNAVSSAGMLWELQSFMPVPGKRKSTHDPTWLEHWDERERGAWHWITHCFRDERLATENDLQTTWEGISFSCLFCKNSHFSFGCSESRNKWTQRQTANQQMDSGRRNSSVSSVGVLRAGDLRKQAIAETCTFVRLVYAGRWLQSHRDERRIITGTKFTRLFFSPDLQRTSSIFCLVRKSTITSQQLCHLPSSARSHETSCWNPFRG